MRHGCPYSRVRFRDIMSMFFFRFHNLQRAEEKRKKFNTVTNDRRNMNSDMLTAPSRLLERPLSEPIDSLDEIALQIPRFIRIVIISLYLTVAQTCLPFHYNVLHLWTSVAKLLSMLLENSWILKVSIWVELILEPLPELYTTQLLAIINIFALT